MMSSFHVILKQLRKNSNMTQPELAQKLGVSRSAISMYELGSREPDFETLEAIADVFNVDMNTLISNDTPDQKGKRPRRPLKLKTEKWKSNKNAHLDMRIDSDLLNWIKIFAGEAGISLEDEIEKILHEDAENRIEEWANEVDAREFAQMPVEMLYSSSWPASVAPTQEAEQEQLQPEQQKMPTPVTEDGLDEMFMRYVQKLTPDQQQMILDQMQRMTGQQKLPSSVFAQQITDETVQ